MRYLKTYEDIQSSVSLLTVKSEINYFFKHLEADGFRLDIIPVDIDRFLFWYTKPISKNINGLSLRIYKPINLSIGGMDSYDNCKPFKWSEIGEEVSRFISEFNKSLAEVHEHYLVILSESVVKGDVCPIKVDISNDDILNEDFNTELVCFNISLKMKKK